MKKGPKTDAKGQKQNNKRVKTDEIRRILRQKKKDMKKSWKSHEKP